MAVVTLLQQRELGFKINSRLREHPLERVWHQKGQRKSPLSLQGLKVSFLRLQSSHYFIQMNTLKQQGGSNVFFLVPYPLQGGARAGESQEQSTRTLIVCLFLIPGFNNDP